MRTQGSVIRRKVERTTNLLDRAVQRGQSRRFLSVYEQYKQAKDITRQRIYLETMRDVLMKMDKIIVDKNSSGVVPYLPLESMKPPAARPQTGETRPGGQQ